MLSQNTIDKLESKGLKLFGKKRDMVMVCKPITTKGNCIEGKRLQPIVALEIINKKLVPNEEQFQTDAFT